MNSSMLAGERRWASARRGGMTVLGKVAVPKPINLPSQRLENHGLDPSVEIVPKGTVSWGSRSSSSGSSPWTSSSLSPNADGGTVSPSHHSGRPSSGGSVTRPSTSGSDRTHDHAPNAWSSSSRPSSASGTLSSNQTSASSLRPRSAENRPNSSQLSRFAEPVIKTSAAWGSSVTAERLGVKSIKEDNFSLTSGDFPTLGSEKDNSVKNVESEDCRPSSASGRIVQAQEDNIPHADIKHGTVNTWKAESTQHTEDEIHPSMDKWQGDPHQYFNPNNGPQRYEGWRGPPMNGPTGGWYGGRPRGPTFGAHVPPGGFPMEPFPYYRPQMPHPSLSGSQPGPQPGPRGPHPKNGDLYRPQMHEAYPRPGMPFRPNFYPGPPGPPGPMPYEGYYGPPMGYCNSERDISYMGMATGPPVYNGYPTPAPDISNAHGRATARPTGKTMSEQVEAGHSEDTRAPRRVPQKIHNEYEQKEEGGHWEQNVPPNISHPGKIRFPVSSRKTEWGAEEDAEEPVFPKRMGPSDNPSNRYENRIHSADSMKVKTFESNANAKRVDDNWTNRSEGPPFPPTVPQLPVASERDAVLPATTKNSALIHKIDGLNAKFRVSDGWNDSASADNRVKERTGSQIVDMKVTDCTREASNAAGSSQRSPAYKNFASSPNEATVPVGDNPMQPIAIIPRRPHHGGHPRVDHRGKGKSNSQDSDGWRRKPLTNDSSSAAIASNDESKPNVYSHGPSVGEASENSVMDSVGKAEGDSAEVCDSADIQAQRARMRELAKQRYLQLQKEEEERAKEQRAKALAKLEELDRRKLAGEAANQKAERIPIIGDTRVEQQESHTVIGTVIAELKTNESGFNLVLSPAVAAVGSDNNTSRAGESVEVSRDLHPVMQQKGLLDATPLPKNEDSEDQTKKVISQPDDGGISRHKRAGYKHKQNNMPQKQLNDKAVSSYTLEAQKDHTRAAVAHTHDPPSSDTRPSESNMLNTPNSVVESSAQQRKRPNKSNKPKPKPEETPSVSALPPVSADITHVNESYDNWGIDDTVSDLGASVTTLSEPAWELSTSLPSEEPQSRVSNQWKPHTSRRIQKNQQSHKHHGSDTVVWAPKAKGSDDVNQNSVQESANSVKSNNMAQNSLKGKRAEMERYVPKPQLAQQGGSPPLSSSVSSSRSNEVAFGEQPGSAAIFANSLPVSSTAANVGANLENVGDSSHNKNKKDQGTWKQRISTDSSQMKGVHTGPTDSSQVKVAHHSPSPVSEPNKEIQQSKEPVQFGRSEVNRVNAEAKISGGNYMASDSTVAAQNKHPSVKDQGATGRGKRHQPRGPRIGGNNPDSENTLYGEVDGSSSQSSASDANQVDKPIVSKENRSFGERTTSSHWQRKSSSNPANYQQGNRYAGSDSVSFETNRNPRKGNPHHKGQAVPQQDKESSNFSQYQPQPGQPVNINSNVADDSVARRHQDFNREKKPAPLKGRPYSPNNDLAGSGEPALTSTDDQLEHNVTSGSRRGGRQNNRPVRGGSDSRGEWSSGHENRQHNTSALRDRQRQNVHLEYQPVGPFKGHKPEKVEELADGGADSMDQRHRERGQTHSRRGGNTYRR